MPRPVAIPTRMAGSMPWSQADFWYVLTAADMDPRVDVFMIGGPGLFVD